MVSDDSINTFKNRLKISSGPIRKCFMIITLTSMASETVVYCILYEQVFVILRLFLGYRGLSGLLPSSP